MRNEKLHNIHEKMLALSNAIHEYEAYCYEEMGVDIPTWINIFWESLTAAEQRLARMLPKQEA